jgi:hypothetical protein
MTSPRPRGRPPHQSSEQNRKTVEAMAGFGIPQHDIARVIGITAETLRTHYGEELDTGGIRANAAIAKNLFRIAQGNGREAVTACIFWLKCRAGWREAAATASPEEAGKKAQAEALARTAPHGTAWAALLN